MLTRRQLLAALLAAPLARREPSWADLPNLPLRVVKWPNGRHYRNQAVWRSDSGKPYNDEPTIVLCR